MIIKGKTRTNGVQLADYLLSEGRYQKNKAKNEQIEVLEACGLEYGDRLQDIISDFDYSATGTKCEKPLFHVQIRAATGEYLTRSQFIKTVNNLEERLELSGHERVIVMHTLNGHGHLHVVWNRIGQERQKTAELNFFKYKCTDMARLLEKEFGLRELSGKKSGKLSHREEQQAIRHGQKPQEIKTAIRECWEQSDKGCEFNTALEQRGYMLAQGDRRNFVVVDEQGGVFSLARITGCNSAIVQSRMADISKSLQCVNAVKEIQRERMITVASMNSTKLPIASAHRNNRKRHNNKTTKSRKR